MFDWNGAPSARETVRCRTFSPSVDGGLPTAALYDHVHTELPNRSPIVLVQHGGSSLKTGTDVWDAANEFVGRGCRVIALDGPVHGGRMGPGTPNDGLSNRARFFHAWEHDPEHVDGHVALWRALLDELVAVWPDAPFCWFGVSMGTAYGLPLLATEPRVTRAVLGMWGTSFVNSERLVLDAAQVQCPVLFQQKWDDELFTREGQLALFDALGCANKRLHAYPGGHVRVQGEQMDDVVSFLVPLTGGR